MSCGLMSCNEPNLKLLEDSRGPDASISLILLRLELFVLVLRPRSGDKKRWTLRAGGCPCEEGAALPWLSACPGVVGHEALPSLPLDAVSKSFSFVCFLLCSSCHSLGHS